MKDLQSIKKVLEHVREYDVYGEVIEIRGSLVECTGIQNFVLLGDICEIIHDGCVKLLAEVLKITTQKVILMPMSSTSGIALGDKVRIADGGGKLIFPDSSWLGRVINALAEPIDGMGRLELGTKPYDIFASPPKAYLRRLVKEPIDFGIKSINCFTTCCYGQRVGIFAGSGIGKSTLLSMLTSFASVDVVVMGLIGERGREVREMIEKFINSSKGKTQQKVIIVASTSDESPLLRKKAAYLVMSICEYFRKLGNQVLCVIDSVTRFALAVSEIGLHMGEPPTMRGYTASVFSELPLLLERAGPGLEGEGDVTGIYSVLTEDEYAEDPISESLKAILDGHILLDRKLFEQGFVPAIDVLKSVSRTMDRVNTRKNMDNIKRAKALISTYQNMSELIRLGLYKHGSDAEVDDAIKRSESIKSFLNQKPEEKFEISKSYELLDAIIK